MRSLFEGRQGTQGSARRVVGLALLAVAVLDGALSLALGHKWVEIQKARLPAEAAQVFGKLEQLPEPIFRALGAAQAIAALFGVVTLARKQ